jgi:hypothetical protein
MARFSAPSKSRWLRRSLALVFVQAILVDLGDAGCDPVIASGSPSAVNSRQEEPREACRVSCVPDCFCCSRSVTESWTSVLAELGPHQPTPAPSSSGVAPGVPPPVDHPPRSFTSAA